MNLFLDERWRQVDISEYEIVIADDHGEDNTLAVISPVIQQLKNYGWQIRYIYRETNLRGDRNLIYGYTGDSKGDYVWFLCDDDLLDVGATLDYLSAVRRTQPLISLCGFTQGANNQLGNFFGGDTRLITNFAEAVNYIIKFPKTTAYLMRRLPDLPLEIIFERWDGTLFSWIGIMIYSMAKVESASVMVYPAVVAYADEGFGELRYSYRIFAKLYPVVKDSLDMAGLSLNDLHPRLHQKCTEGNECSLIPVY